MLRPSHAATCAGCSAASSLLRLYLRFCHNCGHHASPARLTGLALRTEYYGQIARRPACMRHSPNISAAC